MNEKNRKRTIFLTMGLILTVGILLGYSLNDGGTQKKLHAKPGSSTLETKAVSEIPHKDTNKLNSHWNSNSGSSTFQIQNSDKPLLSLASSSEYNKNRIKTRSKNLSAEVSQLLKLSSDEESQLETLMNQKIERDKQISNEMIALIISQTSNNQSLSERERNENNDKLDKLIEEKIGDSWEENRKDYENKITSLLPSEKIQDYRQFEIAESIKEMNTSIDLVIKTTSEQINNLDDYQRNQIVSLGNEYKSKTPYYPGLGSSIALKEGESLFAHPEQLELYVEFQEQVFGILSSDQKNAYIESMKEFFSHN